MNENRDLTEASLKAAFVNNNLQNIPIFFYEETDSTNTRAKNYMGNEQICLFVANSQTAGRGRMGRSFESDSDVGIYASLLLRGSYEPKSALLFTVRAAVGICRAIKSLTGVSAEIKWVNDIILDGRKLSGILTEGVFSDDGKIEKIIIGFGINVYKRSFSEELESIATSLEEKTKTRVSRPLLTARVVEEILAMPDFSTVLEEYRSLSAILDKEITVYKGERSYPATALAITDSANLIVRLADGSEETLSSAEVSVRKR